MDLVLDKIQKAYECRAEFLKTLEDECTTAFRAFGGRPEGIEGLTIDVFGKTAILNVYEDKFNHEMEALDIIVSRLKELYGIHSTSIKLFVNDRSKKSASLPADNEVIEVFENGLKFEIHPNDGLSVGLFLDQRENRKRVAELAKGSRLLNLFSYTCGFSVYAASKAALTVNVDVSKKYLEWGKRNFLLNGISLKGHKFLVEDAGLYLTRLLKRGEKFDVVVVDPPSFGRSDKGVFSVEKDMAAVLEMSLRLLNPGGALFASSNFQKWQNNDLAKFSLRAASRLGVSLHYLEIKRPVDFEKEENPLSAVLFEKRS